MRRFTDIEVQTAFVATFSGVGHVDVLHEQGPDSFSRLLELSLDSGPLEDGGSTKGRGAHANMLTACRAFGSSKHALCTGGKCAQHEKGIQKSANITGQLLKDSNHHAQLAQKSASPTEPHEHITMQTLTTKSKHAARTGLTKRLF